VNVTETPQRQGMRQQVLTRYRKVPPGASCSVRALEPAYLMLGCARSVSE